MPLESLPENITKYFKRISSKWSSTNIIDSLRSDHPRTDSPVTNTSSTGPSSRYSRSSISPIVSNIYSLPEEPKMHRLKRKRSFRSITNDEIPSIDVMIQQSENISDDELSSHEDYDLYYSDDMVSSNSSSCNSSSDDIDNEMLDDDNIETKVDKPTSNIDVIPIDMYTYSDPILMDALSEGDNNCNENGLDIDADEEEIPFDFTQEEISQERSSLFFRKKYSNPLYSGSSVTEGYLISNLIAAKSIFHSSTNQLRHMIMLIKSILPSDNILQPWDNYINDFKRSSSMLNVLHPMLCKHCGKLYATDVERCECGQSTKKYYRLRVFNIRRQLERSIRSFPKLFSLKHLLKVYETRYENVCCDAIQSDMFQSSIIEFQNKYPMYKHFCFLHLSSDGFLVKNML